MRVLRTGVMPANTIGNVEIPTLALGNFHRVFPIGLYSLWKAGGGVRFAAPGALNIATGSLQRTGSILRPAALIYGPDVLTYSFAALQLHLMGAWDN